MCDFSIDVLHQTCKLPTRRAGTRSTITTDATPPIPARQEDQMFILDCLAIACFAIAFVLIAVAVVEYLKERREERRWIASNVPLSQA